MDEELTAMRLEGSAASGEASTGRVDGGGGELEREGCGCVKSEHSMAKTVN